MPKYKIPLTAQSQRFQITLAAKTYGVLLTWCDAANVWLLSFDDENGVPVLHSVPLVADTDLLAPFAYMGFDGTLVASTTSAAFTPPTQDNLGKDSFVYFTTP